VTSAARLCRAYDSALFRLDGSSLRLVAHHGPIPSVTRLPVVRDTVGGRAVLEGQAVHVADIQAEVEAFPEGLSRLMTSFLTLVASRLSQRIEGRLQTQKAPALDADTAQEGRASATPPTVARA